LLFENKGLRQIILKNTFWLAVSELVSRGLGLVLIVYVIRILGAEEYGKFAFALAFVSMLVIFADFGIPTTVTREFSKGKENENEFASIVVLKLLLSAGVIIVMFGVSFFVAPDPVIQKLIWILSPFALISNFFLLIYGFLQARQRMEYQALLQIGQSVLLSSVGFYVILNFPSVENISYAYMVANAIALMAMLVFFHFCVFRLKISWDIVVVKKFIHLSWPLALTAIFASLFVNIDSIMLGYFNQIIETGWYNAAFKIIGAVMIPATLIGTSFYPTLSKSFRESQERLHSVLNFQIEIMIILALPIVVGGLLLAPQIINFFYGATFAPATPAFQILILMVGFMFIYVPFYLVLLASNQQKKVFWITFTGAVINIFLNFILIPRYSLYGAAVAILAAYVAILMLVIEVVGRTLSFSLFNQKILAVFLVGAISTTIMMGAIILLLISRMHILSVIFIGTMVYLTTLFFFFQKGFKAISIKHWGG